jgi:hypothetical protein
MTYTLQVISATLMMYDDKDVVMLLVQTPQGVYKHLDVTLTKGTGLDFLQQEFPQLPFKIVPV